MDTSSKPHIAVCICTYKRPKLLRRLLADLKDQQTNSLFTYSIVVVDNDRGQSAKEAASEFAAASPVPMTYCVEPEQNIALARNRAVANAKGDFIAFIDDDEFPTRSWLLTLFKECMDRGVDGVLGPVKPHYDVQPPQWVIDGKFYDRPSYPTGFVIDWRKGRTGNVLLKRSVFEGMKEPFRVQFGGGAEDQDFFRRMIESGKVFIWCDEAVAYEVVPPIRWKRTFMIRRALLRGKMAFNHPTARVREIAKSTIAVPIYAVALPFTAVLGHHRFMNCLLKLCDHGGKILALFGLNPAPATYVTE